jgi:hypothetical protein
VLEPSRSSDLTQEPLGAEDCGQFAMHRLESDGPIVPQVVGKVDCRHTPAAKLALK